MDVTVLPTALSSSSAAFCYCSMQAQSESGWAFSSLKNILWRSPVVDIDVISSEKFIKCLTDRSEAAQTFPMKCIDAIFNYLFPLKNIKLSSKRSLETLQKQEQANKAPPENYVYDSNWMIDECESDNFCFRKIFSINYINLGWGTFIGEDLPLPLPKKEDFTLRTCSHLLYVWRFPDNDPHLSLSLSLGDPCTLFSQQRSCIAQYFEYNLFASDLLKHYLEVFSTNQTGSLTQVSVTAPSGLRAANWTLKATGYRLEPKFEDVPLSPQLVQILEDLLQKIIRCERLAPKQQIGGLFSGVVLSSVALGVAGTLLVAKYLKNQHRSESSLIPPPASYGSMGQTTIAQD